MHILERLDSYAVLKKDIVAYNNNANNPEEGQLTYNQLIDYSDRLAFYLENTLGNNKTPLVVYGHKSPYILVCFLACVKSGRAYCPIDISVPLERTKDIICETDSPIVLTTENLEFHCDREINLSKIKNIIQTTNLKIDKSKYVKAGDVFYIIFTSGSTGKPKGVQITTECLGNFLDWAVTLGGKDLTENQLTFINQAPFSFDLSVMDLYLSLYLGGTLWCLEKTVQADAKTLFASLHQSEANVWVSTPSFANMCLAGDVFNESLMPKIKLFLFCGETLTNSTVEKLHKRFPQATVVNTYGPTESTVAITEVIVTPELNAKFSPLPVGKPKPGTFIFITDENGKALPDGEKGEILIVGDSVSIGYFNRPDLTKKVFSECTVNGITYRSYRTGDEGYIKDGLLYYSGRIDLQIKLHGYRIEIEDIENNLLKLPSIKSAVVVPVVKNGAVESLTAFVIVGFEVISNLKASQQIRKELSEFLPLYMIPKKFIFVNDIPMTNNGKANRKKLMEEL